MPVTSARSKVLIKAEIEQLRLEIMRLVRRKFGTRHIASKLGVSDETVRRHVKYCTRRLIADQLDIALELRDEAIEDLKEDIRASYEAFDRSGRDEYRCKYQVDEQGNRVLAEETITGRAPAPGHMSNILSARSKIFEILGLIGGDKFETTTIDQTPRFLRVVVESRADLEKYESLKIEQLHARGIIEGSAKPSPPSSP
jgi:hypothetical protein